MQAERILTAIMAAKWLTVAALVAMLVIILSGSFAPQKEPRFQVGDVVAFKLLPVVGVVNAVYTCLHHWCDARYLLRLSAAGQLTVADEVELELLYRRKKEEK